MSCILIMQIMNDNFFCDDLIGRVDIDVKEVLAAAAKDQVGPVVCVHSVSCQLCGVVEVTCMGWCLSWRMHRDVVYAAY